jgi:PAS domain S-box-containing protein
MLQSCNELPGESQLPKGDVLSWAASARHVVQFYDEENFLYDVVGRYLSAGLEAGEPLIVIASREHLPEIGRRLAAADLDLASAAATARLTLLDAEETLSRFMAGSMPDAERFFSVVGDAVRRAAEATPSGHVRAYGEMVDVLWRQGNPQAALRLEELWNELGQKLSFSLLCGYSMLNFTSASDGAPFGGICDVHTRVMPSEGYHADEHLDARLRQVSLLQQRARALESEIEHRRRLEKSLIETLAELRRSEDALRESQQELRDFVDNAVEGIHSVGPDGTVLWANDAELQMLGYTREEYVGHHIAEFHADAAVIEDILARLSRNETIRDREARLEHKDGSVRHVMINANVLWKDGRFVHTRCFTRDVTERKKLAEEREKLIESLQRTVRFSDTFLGILGHDLRNPLNAIATSANLLMRRSDSETLAKPISRILSSADRMARMIDQLLDFTRIRLGGGLRLDRRPADVQSIVAAVVEELDTIHGGAGIQVEARGEMRGEWDADRLSQLISNLAGNALQHRTPGSRVHVRLDGTHAHELRMEFHNEGMVPEEILPVLFEPFHGDADRRSVHSSGLGLGLYISQQVVVAHGGSIEVTTSSNPGTKVTVQLPRAASSGEADSLFGA